MKTETEFTTTATGNSSEATFYLHVETPVERCARKSNEYALMAIGLGSYDDSGYDDQLTAEAYAELADLYALLGSVLGNAELLAWSLPS